MNKIESEINFQFELKSSSSKRPTSITWVFDAIIRTLCEYESILARCFWEYSSCFTSQSWWSYSALAGLSYEVANSFTCDFLFFVFALCTLIYYLCYAISIFLESHTVLPREVFIVFVNCLFKRYLVTFHSFHDFRELHDCLIFYEVTDADETSSCEDASFIFPYIDHLDISSN